MKKLLFAVALLCAGCAPDPDTPMMLSSPALVRQARFSVTRVGVIRDDIAYDERRGIYVLHDESTGKDYVGISGVGISELGSHSQGKTQAPDER